MSPWAREDRELWRGVIDTVPDVFQTQVNEPAFMLEGIAEHHRLSLANRLRHPMVRR